jgi:hypothetical protein
MRTIPPIFITIIRISAVDAPDPCMGNWSSVYMFMRGLFAEDREAHFELDLRTLWARISRVLLYYFGRYSQINFREFIVEIVAGFSC